MVSLGDKLFRGAGVGAVPAGPTRGVDDAIFVGGFDVGTGGAFRRTFAISAKFSSLALKTKISKSFDQEFQFSYLNGFELIDWATGFSWFGLS